MEKRANAVTFKGKPLTLIGPQLKVGDKAPAFTCVTSTLELAGLDRTAGKPCLLSAVPSLDTPVCSEETRKFDQALAGLKDKLNCFTISLDLPFAQKRFCAAENIGTMQTLSDTHNGSFGKNYGVLIEGLPFPLFSRAVFVLDRSGKIAYVEYVPEVASHPNYDNALNAIKSVVAG
jgi:thiol peroxidase